MFLLSNVLYVQALLHEIALNCEQIKQPEILLERYQFVNALVSRKAFQQQKRSYRRLKFQLHQLEEMLYMEFQ
jgi:hypothetical protein